jgi:Ca2+-transporting ATPase
MVTVVLSIGVQRMAKSNAIVRRLPAVETLGCASVICSDKTGTLTQNRMTVTQIRCQGTGGKEQENRLLRLAALCCNAEPRGGRQALSGDPTEVAIVAAAQRRRIPFMKDRETFPRLKEIPFDSKRKLMTTVHRDGVGFMSITKGAPDVLLRRCTHYFENGKTHNMTIARRNEILKHVGKMADKALRVLAVSFRRLDSAPKGFEFDCLEENLIFTGLVGMMDPPRPEVRGAVATCMTAGIRPVMITGDHPQTALAVAKSIGIGLNHGDDAVTGEDIARLSQEELERIVEHTAVFARVSPEHKVRIVKAYQKNGHVVAMTGDGVNDAPALKAADIGCAMGINGTEVAKGAADIVLTDDNFATIVHAVEEGRGILTNIRKAVHFLLSSNIGEIITIFMAVILGWQVPLLAIHLLWVNLVTDSLPAIALGLDPVSGNIMQGRPRTSRTGLFSRKLWQRIFLEGAMIGMLSLIAFGVGTTFFDIGDGVAYGRTMAFATLSISQLVHAFNMRSETSILRTPIFENRYLVGALIIGVMLQVGVISLTTIANIFRVVPLPAEGWLIVAALSLLPIIIVEIEKYLLYPRQRTAKA